MTALQTAYNVACGAACGAICGPLSTLKSCGRLLQQRLTRFSIRARQLVLHELQFRTGSKPRYICTVQDLFAFLGGTSPPDGVMPARAAAKNWKHTAALLKSFHPLSPTRHVALATDPPGRHILNWDTAIDVHTFNLPQAMRFTLR